jgi:hypothetical protein
MQTRSSAQQMSLTRLLTIPANCGSLGANRFGDMHICYKLNYNKMSTRLSKKVFLADDTTAFFVAACKQPLVLDLVAH